MTGKVSYRGNCHCARFRFEVTLPEIKSAISCDCLACFKTGFLWAFPDDGDYKVTRDDGLLTDTQHGGTLEHKFCSNCSSPVIGTHITGALKGRFGINVRTLLNVNPFLLDIVKSSHPDAPVKTYKPPVDSAGLQVYEGSCTCGAVVVTLKSKPLPEVEIKEDNCSACVRNANIGVYPSKSNVDIPSSSYANASTYAWGQSYGASRFCKHCGIVVFGDLYGPPASLLATWSEARQAMVARKLDIKPLSVRTLEGVEWDQIKIERSDEGTDGYVVD